MYEEQSAQRYTFKGEWREPENCKVTEFRISYYLVDGTIDLFDFKKNRLFLRRTPCHTLSLKDLFIGNTVNIMSRSIIITDYWDSMTRQEMAVRMQRTFGIIKPNQMDNLGPILESIHVGGFIIGHMQMVQLTKEMATEVYSTQESTVEETDVVSHLTSGPVVVLELLGDNAIQRWNDFVGPKDPDEARKTHPTSLIARFGRDCVKNGFHCSVNPTDVERVLKIFFSGKPGKELSAELKNSTCCIVKPHAYQAGLLGPIVTSIQKAGFKLGGLRLISLDQSAAEEFLEVYSGVVPEYPAMVTQLSSGPCVVLEVVGKDENTVSQFRELVGPSDVELAHKLRPNSLRAKFGTNKVLNAVHCTDMPEDGLLEVEYFFKLLR